MNLLAPGLLAMRNDWRSLTRRDWFRNIILFSFVFLLAALVAAGIHFVLRYVMTLGPFGPLLLRKLLSMFFLFLFIILFFSSLITSLSTFYLAQDLELLLRLPISPARLFRARFWESFHAASWMIGLFGLFVLFDLGAILGAKPLYFICSTIILLIFMMIPVQLATLFSMALVSIFPARSTRDFLFFLCVLFAVGLYLFFRFLRPEQLINPDQFAGVMEYFAALRTPDSVFLPSHWAYETTKGLWPNAGDFDFLWPLLLTSTVLALDEIGISLFGWLHLEGFSKTQEARQKTFFAQNNPFEKWLLRWIYQNPRGFLRALFMKDLRIFRRDSFRSSQMLMIVALIVVYVYNFRVLDLRSVPIQQSKLEFWISILNLGTAAFVLSALGARFLFPAVSLEGRAFWILGSSPLTMSQFLWAKFWLALPWSLGLGILLLEVTNYLLHVTPFLHALTFITLLPLSFALTAMATGMGAIYPVFKFDNIAKVTTGFGAILYMMLSMGFVILILAIISIAARFFLLSLAKEGRMPAFPTTILLAAILITFLLSTLATWLPMQRGIRCLQESEFV